MHPSEARRLKNAASAGLGQQFASQRLEWTWIILSTLLIGSGYLDAWAHLHGRTDTAFFSIWHAALYSTYLVLAIYLGLHVLRDIARGVPWRHAWPVGYGWPLVGVLGFWVGGMGDMIWHTLFGIEVNVEALFSPTHLMLSASVWLIVGAPFRAAWQRVDDTVYGLRQQLPVLMSTALMMSAIAFTLKIGHPVGTIRISGEMPSPHTWVFQEMGMMTFVWDTALLMGFVLLLMRRWRLAPGAITCIMTVNAWAMGFVLSRQPFPLDHFVARVVAGVVADLLYMWLQPSAQQLRSLRGFACAVPVINASLFVMTVHLSRGIWWTIHLWAGMIVLTGAIGVLCSYLVTPPPYAAPSAQAAD